MTHVRSFSFYICSPVVLQYQVLCINSLKNARGQTFFYNLLWLIQSATECIHNAKIDKPSRRNTSIVRCTLQTFDDITECIFIRTIPHSMIHLKVSHLSAFLDFAASMCYAILFKKRFRRFGWEFRLWPSVQWHTVSVFDSGHHNRGAANWGVRGWTPHEIFDLQPPS